MRSFTLDYRPGLPAGQILAIGRSGSGARSGRNARLRDLARGHGSDPARTKIAIEEWKAQSGTWDRGERDPEYEYAPCFPERVPGLVGDEQDHVRCQHLDHARVFVVWQRMIGHLCPNENPARTGSRPGRSRPRTRS